MKFFRYSRPRGAQNFFTLALAFFFATTTLVACAGSSSTSPSQSGDIHKIQHVVVIMQENRSFTFPGADGIPANVCVPDPATNQCVKPFHDPNDKNSGGPHGASNAAADINGEKMDGFIQQELKGSTKACKNNFDPACSLNQQQPDVMGYHDAREIPNYWTYAEQFVLQDHMFEPNASWSLPEHLFMVSEWSAKCTQPGNAMSCQNALQNPQSLGQGKSTGLVKRPDYAWTDLTYLLHKANVSWRYYIMWQMAHNRTAKTMRCSARPSRNTREHLRSGIRCPTSIRSGKTASLAISSRSRNFILPRKTVPCPQFPGLCQMGRTANIHRPWSALGRHM